MGLLQDIANILSPQQNRTAAKPVVNMILKRNNKVLPPEMVSSTATGQAQVPYMNGPNRLQPISINSVSPQLGQIQQLRRIKLQRQSEYNNLQGYENPGEIPLQSGGSYINRIQPQQYERMIQGF